MGLILGSVGLFAAEIIKIGASPVPHAKMLEFAKASLFKQGYDLKIIEFSDYVTPNMAVSQKQLDANFFQHEPYLLQYNRDHGTNLVTLVKVHLEPMGIYANPSTAAGLIKAKNAKAVVKGAVVGVPNDPTNEGRALNLLAANGFIKIKAGVAYPTKKDVAINSYKLRIMELDPAMLPRALAARQLDIAVINSNFALAANLNPKRDALFIEGKNSPFANIVAVRPEEIKQAKIQALAKVLTSAAMKQYIESKYNGAVLAAF